MSRLYQETENLAENIRFYQSEMEKEKALFEKYSPAVRAIDERVYELFESGYRDSMYWSQHGIDMANEYLGELHREMVNRSEGARKAAATRKANKEKQMS
jgi:hypothetical protein